MDAVGFGASILTFVTVAVSLSKSIHNTLSQIKDGPETVRLLSNEISQLGTILQRFLQVSSSIARPTERSELEQLVKKCKEDLAEFKAKLLQLGGAGAGGRRGRLWRKIKICYEEKDLEQIRQVVRWHVNLLTLHLGIVQAQQSPLSTDILPILQQIDQGVTALQVSDTSAKITQVEPSGISSRVIDSDDIESPISQQNALNESIARLMKLLERKPCVMESDDSQEILNDLERLLQFVQHDSLSVKMGGGDGDKTEDISNEVKLFTSLIVSAPFIKINQTDPMSSFDTKEPRVAIFQETKRKEMHTNDADLTVTTTKRREKFLFVSKNTSASESYGRGFVGNLTFKSKTKKKMITLSVHQSQLLFDRFTSLLPQVIVCNILSNDSPVFEVAAKGSAEDLMRLIVENKAGLHDHDEDGWSLLHHAIGNLPTFTFLIQQGLDVTEIAKDKIGHYKEQINTLTIAFDYKHDISFSETLLHAGADPTTRLKGRPILVEIATYGMTTEARKLLHRTFSISPFVFPASPDASGEILFGFCHTWASIPGKEFNPEQERKILDLLISHGYNDQADDQLSASLRGFFSSHKRSFSKVLERRDLLVYLISRSAESCKVDLAEDAPSYYAYGKQCKTCSMSQSSLMGDLWDSILDIHGYDISIFRQNCPRIACYKHGYTREMFEQLWSGREDRCPYWDDDPWPKFLNKEAQLNAESEVDQGLCVYCSSCVSRSSHCHSCGVCLLVFQYLCYWKLDPDHKHNHNCPRIRVGFMELCESCGRFEFRPKVCSSLDSDDGKYDRSDSCTWSDESEDEQSQAHEEITQYCNCEFEEVSSDNESLGGAEL